MAVDVDINLNLEGTERSESLLKRMTDTIQAQRKELETLNRVGQLEGLKQGEREVNALTGRLAAMAKEMQHGSNESDELVKNLRDVANAAGLVEEKAENAAKAVAKIPSSGAVASTRHNRNARPSGVYFAGSGTTGDVAGDIGTLGSNLGSITGSSELAALGTIGDLVEGSLRLRGSVQELNQALALQSAANAAVQGSAAGAATGTTAAAGGLTALALAALPIVAVGAAIGAGFLILKDNIEDSKDALEATIKAEKDRTESIQRQREYLESLTLAENARQQKQNQQLIDDLFAEGEAIRAAFGDAAPGAGFASGLNQTANEMQRSGNIFKQVMGTVTDAVIHDSVDPLQTAVDDLEKINQQILDLQGKNADLAAVTPERADLEAAQDAIRILDEYGEEQKRLNELIQGGSEAVRGEIRSLEEQKRINKENIAIAREQRDTFEEGSAAFIALDNRIDDYIDANREIDNQLIQLRGSTLDAAQAVDEQARATERAKKAIEDAAKAFDEAVSVFEKADSELKDGVQARIKAQADVVKAENAIADVQAKRAADDTRNAERAAAEQNILDQIENAKRVSAAAKVADNIGRIRDEGYAKEQDITAKFLNDSAKALNDYNAQVEDLNAKFQTEDLRATEDYNIQRFRLARDLETGLFEAARNNDVSSFITQRRRGAAQIGDLDTDFAIDRRRAGEDQGSNLQDLRESFEAERAERQAAAQQSIAQTRAEVQERIATEQAGAVQRITQEQVLQQQLADLRAMYAQEDFLARRAEEDMRLREQVANAQIRFGLAQQTERLLADQAAIAGRNVGIMLINGFVNGVNQYQNAVAAAGFGAAGSIFQNFNFGNIQVGNGMTPPQVKAEIKTAVQAGIDQMGKRGGTVFRTREA